MFKLIKMKIKLLSKLITFALLIAMSTSSHAVIEGVTGTNFNLKTKAGYITTPDGDSLLVWGYALNDGPMQYPGPTLIVNQGDTINISLDNSLAVPVSMLFPGQKQVFSSGGTQGALTKEAGALGGANPTSVEYSFVATKPGTYMYQSGTNPEIQIEMGLFGALIVRPPAANQAYSHPDTSYDYEYLFMLSEMDPAIHLQVETGQTVDNTNYKPLLWFINGRNAPDTMADSNVSWLPNQPYNAIARVHPGDKALIRILVASRDSHPFHTHGNHIRILAQDGNLLESAAGLGPDLSYENFTVHSVPGATYDGIWEWTGKDLGWDIYGHTSADNIACNPDAEGFDIVTREFCANHEIEIPVVLPELQDLAFGGFYSGSPYLDSAGSLPPGEGGLNLNNGMFYMWHSHNAKEQVNNDIFPGGMTTMMIVEPPGVPIP